MSKVGPVERLGFIRSMARAPELSGAAVKVGVMLVDRYHQQRGYAYPSQAWLAAALRINDRTVRKAIEQLERGGWFLVEGEGGRNNACRYVPDWARAAAADVPVEVENLAQTGQVSDADKPGPHGPRLGGRAQQKPGPSAHETRPVHVGNPAHSGQKPGPAGPTIPMNNPESNPENSSVSVAAAPQDDSFNEIEDEGKPARQRHTGEGVAIGAALGKTEPLTTAEKASRFEAALIDYAKKELSRERFERWLLGFIEDPSRVEAESIALDARRRADGPNGLPPKVALMQARGAVRSNIRGRARPAGQVAIRPIGVGG